jgi:hypothetical protein
MLKILFCFTVMFFCVNLNAEEQANTWYAGTEFQGEVNVVRLRLEV